MKEEFKQAINDLRQGLQQSWVRPLLSYLQLAKTIQSHRSEIDEASAFEIMQVYHESYRFIRWWFHSYIAQNRQGIFDRVEGLINILESAHLFNQANFDSLLAHDFFLDEGAGFIFWNQLPRRLLTQEVLTQLVELSGSDNAANDINEYVNALSTSGANGIPLKRMRYPTPVSPLSPDPLPGAVDSASRGPFRRQSSTASTLGLLDADSQRPVAQAGKESTSPAAPVDIPGTQRHHRRPSSSAGLFEVPNANSAKASLEGNSSGEKKEPSSIAGSQQSLSPQRSVSNGPTFEDEADWDDWEEVADGASAPAKQVGLN